MGGNLHHLEPVNQGWLSFQGVCFCRTAQCCAGRGRHQGKLTGSHMREGRWDDYNNPTGLKTCRSTAATLVVPVQKSEDWWIKYVPPPSWNLSKGQSCVTHWAHQPAPAMVGPACMENLIAFLAWAPWLVAICGNLSKDCRDPWQSMEKGSLLAKKERECWAKALALDALLSQIQLLLMAWGGEDMPYHLLHEASALK